MLKLLVKSVVLSACMYGLVGCGGGGMPSCSDKDVKEALQDKFKQLFKEESIKDESMPDDIKDLMVENFSFDFDSFTTESSDEKAKKVTCKAKVKMEMKLTDKALDKMIDSMLESDKDMPASLNNDEFKKVFKDQMKKEFQKEFTKQFGGVHEEEGKYTAQRTDDGKIVIELLGGFKP